MWPEPRAAICSPSSRGASPAREVDRQHASTYPGVKDVSSPACDSAAFADEHVHVTGLLDEPRRPLRRHRGRQPPRCPSLASPALELSARRPVTITVAPRAASARAAAAPMPPVAPVTRTLRPPRFTRRPRSSP